MQECVFIQRANSSDFNNIRKISFYVKNRKSKYTKNNKKYSERNLIL